MKKNRLLLILGLLLAVTFVLGACGTADEEEDTTGNNGDNTNTEDATDGGEETDFSVAMVTDTGGVDDKSFNQSSWEGLQEFGEEYGLVEMEGYTYAQSESDADYSTNLNRLVQQDYDLIYGIGYLLADAVSTVAEQNPDTNFGIVDSVIDADNVASITFKEHQGSFLVGVAAALKSESGKVGFVGGVDSDLIKKFESGYRAGVKSVDPSIEVSVQYAASFGDAAKGKAIAASMYNSGVDVIYHASGATGNGVFAQAKDIKNNDPDASVWVIGVDRNQYEEGAIGDTNVTLTSMVKRVDVAVKSVSEQAMNGNFPGGEILEFGLADNGISVADTNEEAYTEDIATVVEEWKQKLLDGEVEAPSTEEELEAYLETL
ncbi:putative lipoprotein YufN [Paraliobacillus quinghaiensis]|uniref:Lipoprotein YufN n=1 Tax=Paraliobacillus quinghaiensis TaxID=470815 RepID=A0A917WQR3_9BACI|nr:BMP family ABC transporter substrate-binding protein [Paraliobacillus quinghaiensis]GGM21921.1 putative lipoprotein YufN [Paraliobacillus quinghaiensis]